MKWLDRLSEALAYMEDNLGAEISYEKAAKLAGSSVYHFQRMFPYLAGVTLSEYLRRRRMTKAALDLQHGDKVLDVALRYGYESPTAFNRALPRLRLAMTEADVSCSKTCMFKNLHEFVYFPLPIAGS